MLSKYAQRSKILNKTDAWDETLNSEENRLVNMLNSADIGLRRDAAKIILRNISLDKKVLAAATALSTMAQGAETDSLSIDTMSWLCKTLAASGDSQYVKVLEQAYSITEDLKLRSYCSKSIISLAADTKSQNPQVLELLVDEKMEECLTPYGRTGCDRNEIRQRTQKELTQEEK